MLTGQTVQPVDGPGPLVDVGVRAEPRSRGVGRCRLDQVTGEDHPAEALHPRIGDGDHQVTAAVTLTEMDDLDHPLPAQLDHVGDREQGVGHHQVGWVEAQVAGLLVDPVRAQRLGQGLVPDRRDAGEPGQAEGVVEVVVGGDHSPYRTIGDLGHPGQQLGTLGGAGAGVDHHGAVAAHDQAQVDRRRLGDQAVDTVGDLLPGAELPATPGGLRDVGGFSHTIRLALRTKECQSGPDRRDGRAVREEDPCSTTASWRSSGPSSPTTSPARSRSGPRRWSIGTTSACHRQRSATTWRCWRRRGTSPSRTPAPAGSRPTRATGCSWTGSAR